MKITIRSPLIMFIFGWGTFPSYVKATPNLWWQWLKEGRKQPRSTQDIEIIAIGIAADTAAQRGYHRHWYTICEQSQEQYRELARATLVEG